MNVEQAIKILGLAKEFTIAELKSAYRQAALEAHPDCGGTSEQFCLVDKAYDSLQYCVSDRNKRIIIDSIYWKTRFYDLEKEFKKAWKQAYKDALEQKTGLWYSTAIARFTRAFMHPQDGWFQGVIFNNPTTVDRGYYQEFLLEVAPNRKLREEWAIKYYRLEFGYSTPYTFYLPPAKVPATV